MRLILFRHGPAGRRDVARWPDGGVRPLTTRGEQRTRAAAHGLTRWEPEIHSILTSPLARAAATARILAEAVGDAEVEAVEALRPGGSWRQVLAVLSAPPAERTVVLVGHEPDLGKLAGTLIFGAPTAIAMK